MFLLWPGGVATKVVAGRNSSRGWVEGLGHRLGGAPGDRRPYSSWGVASGGLRSLAVQGLVVRELGTSAVRSPPACRAAGGRRGSGSRSFGGARSDSGGWVTPPPESLPGGSRGALAFPFSGCEVPRTREDGGRSIPGSGVGVSREGRDREGNAGRGPVRGASSGRGFEAEAQRARSRRSCDPTLLHRGRQASIRCHRVGASLGEDRQRAGRGRLRTTRL